MGKLSTELLLCFINAAPTSKNVTLSTTYTLNEITEKYGQDIHDNDFECSSVQKKFLSDFHGTFSIGNHPKLSIELPGLYPSSDRNAQKEVSEKITQELEEIGCTHQDKMALAILATQNSAIKLTNIIGIGLPYLFEPWNLDTALQSTHGSRCENIYRENNKIRCQQDYMLAAIRDKERPILVADNSLDADEEQAESTLVQLNSPIKFTTRYSLTRIGNSFTYKVDTEEIELPAALKAILKTKIETEFNKPIEEINIDPDRLLCLAAFAEIDEDLRNTIFKFKPIVEKLLVGVLKQTDLRTHIQAARAQLITLIVFARLDINFRATLLKNALFKDLFKSVLKNSGAQMDCAQLISLVAFAETDKALQANILKFKPLLKKLFKITLQESGNQILQPQLHSLIALAEADTNLKISFIAYLKNYTGLELFKRINDINPSFALHLFANEKYRQKLVLKNGELNEEFFQYLTELVQPNLDPNSDSLLFAIKLVFEIVQDKHLIPKLISSNKFGDALFNAPGEGLQKLAEATPKNILGEITKYSGLLIRICLANSTLRKHFNEKMTRCIDKNKIAAALENSANHVGLMTYVLLKDRKQLLSNYKKSNIDKSIATQFSKAHENEQMVNTSCLFTAALEFQSLALKLLKKIELFSADKAQVMLSHPNSKKIAREIFQRYSWPKRWFVTSPCYKLKAQDLLICYLRSPQAKYYIQKDKKLMHRLFSDPAAVKDLVQEKLTKAEIIALYSNNARLRNLIDQDVKLHKVFLSSCYDLEFSEDLSVKNKHIAALFLLYPELRKIILADVYFASCLYNNTNIHIVNALLETKEFQEHVTHEIKQEMQRRITSDQSIITLSTTKNELSVDKPEAITNAVESNTNIHEDESKTEENIDSNKSRINWKKTLDGFSINKNVLNAVCSLGIYSKRLGPAAAIEILQHPTPRVGIGA